MVEHALMARHITCIEGGVDSIMGLSTSSLGDLIATVGRVNASGGDMLARPDLRRWYNDFDIIIILSRFSLTSPTPLSPCRTVWRVVRCSTLRSLVLFSAFL